MFGAEQIQAEVGADIRPSRFVKLDGSNNQTLLESNANERVLGISQPGFRDPPNILGGSTNAGEAGDQMEYFPAGRVTRIEIAGTIAANDEIESDADGKGVKVTGAGDHEVAAVALEAGVANDLLLCLITPGFRQIA